MIAWNLALAVCDIVGCTRPVAGYCRCRRCDREAADEVFFTCGVHAGDVNAKHWRIRGYQAEWIGGDAESRAADRERASARRFRSADEVHAAWAAHELSRLDYVTNVRPFLGPATIDAITAKMPAPVLETFERFAQGYGSSDSLSVGRGPEAAADPPDLAETLRQWRERRRETVLRELVAASCALVGAKLVLHVGDGNCGRHEYDSDTYSGCDACARVPRHPRGVVEDRFLAAVRAAKGWAWT